MSEQASQGRGRRQMLVGRVVSDKMDRTVVVAVENTVLHDLYRRQTKKRLKRWRVAEILERSEE
jgi:small subunit ribosomal protein S17